MTPLLLTHATCGSLELTSKTIELRTTPCVRGLITGFCACFASKAAFRSNAFIPPFGKLAEIFQHSASRIQVEDSLPAGFDANAHSDVAVPFRSSFDHVRSHWQYHDPGNFIAIEM